MPRVSIIIPTYNRARLLDEAIQSVLAQSFTDWELIVVDDGSTDETAEVVSKYGNRVLYRRQENRGACAARNLGLACASGEYVSFLDSDDCMLSHNLENLVGLLDTRPAVGIAYGWYYWVEADGSPSKRGGPHIRNTVRPSPWPGANVRPSGTTIEGRILPKLLLEETILLGAALIRRTCIDAVGGFDPTVDYNEHWNFFLNLARNDFEYACCREVVALLRLHEGNRGQQFDKMLAGRLQVLDRFFSETELQERLAKVRSPAYYNALMEYARAYFSVDDVVRGAHCLDQALRHRSLRTCDLRVLTGIITCQALAAASGSAEKYARAVFDNLTPGTDSRLLRRKLLGKIHASLARERVAAKGLGPVVLWHCFQAVWHDSTMKRTEEVARIVWHGALRLVGVRGKPLEPSGHLHINA